MSKAISRTIGEPGLNIIKHFEQCRLKAYMPTPNDVPTIGWGHTRGVKMGMVCTQTQADRWLLQDCEDAERDVNWRVRVPITQNQFDALTSFAFNVGGGNFGSSTLLRKLNGGDYMGASKEFGKWVYQKPNPEPLGGLVKRREMERLLFLTQPEQP